MADKNEHQFLVTVSGCDREQAEEVMTERILYGEDYGFDYEISFEPVKTSGSDNEILS